MDKVVLVFCKIENCYDNGESYEKRKNQMTLFFEKLRNIKKINNADRVLFSFFSYEPYETYYIKPTEIVVNLTNEYKFIDMSKHIFKDESHEINYHKPIENCYEITKHIDSVTLESEIIRYINESQNNYDVQNIIFITDEKIPVEDNSYDIVITQPGFQHLISSLEKYEENVDTKKYRYARVV